VSKNGLLLVSLVGAIPGAWLVCLMVMAFMNHAAGPSIYPKALAGLALLSGLLLTVMPIGIFVFGGPRAEKAPAEKSGDEADVAVSGSEEIVAESDDGFESSSGVTDENLEVIEGEPDEFAMTGEVVTGDADSSSEEFDLGSDFEIGGADDEAVEVLEDDDEFDDDAPKKKHK
jgi:hypothetical protein